MSDIAASLASAVAESRHFDPNERRADLVLVRFSAQQSETSLDRT